MSSSFELFLDTLSEDQHKKLRTAYAGKNILVTGGASFIGSHLVDFLIGLGSQVVVVDDFSSGKKEFVSPLIQHGILQGDLRDRDFAYSSIQNVDKVFHLAAIHGGRGFIETQQRAMLQNLAIDNNVFSAAVDSGAEMIVHASSACSYPVDLQDSEVDTFLLSEEQASMKTAEGSFADGVYGWTKLIGEYQLEHTIANSPSKGRSARIFTAYGDRENESHAAVALLAKAVLRADPYPIWGSGKQTRNFTYVADTVGGLIFLGADDRDLQFDVFNVGTSEHIRVIDFVEEIFRHLNWAPTEINFQLDKPAGVSSRASDNSKIRSVFGWEPQVNISLGIQRMKDWYLSLDSRPESLEALELKLMAR